MANISRLAGLPALPGPPARPAGGRARRPCRGRRPAVGRPSVPSGRPLDQCEPASMQASKQRKQASQSMSLSTDFGLFSGSLQQAVF